LELRIMGLGLEGLIALHCVWDFGGRGEGGTLGNTLIKHGILLKFVLAALFEKVVVFVVA
jgi:hypothetical protein